MKRIIIALAAAVICNAAVASDPTFFAVAPNAAGGELILTLDAAPQCHADEYRILSTDALGRVGWWGCWKYLDNRVVVYWDSGTLAVFKTSAFHVPG